ncbi:tryptophan synthase subunit alpha [Virgibacillus xinjiangensis]|uniref:Tryptophan synthase alpha chain n=1 Tax=Virgibacillus xinjiangensis TaxID=393090 RepID=A0ABV7CZ14_9BACI
MGKEKLKKTLQQKQDTGQNLFVPYIMAGDGGLDILEERITFLQECGASAVELGIPFSDPVADGPTIQEAGIRALEQGVSLSMVLDHLSSFKEKRSIPVILMTYFNPILIYGPERFANACDQAGVDGVIIPDLPLEEQHTINGFLNEKDIAFIQLAAMTSPDERLSELAGKSEGFLYAVSVIGTTGVRATHNEKVKGFLEKLKEYSNVPVLAGFGVSNAAQARELSNAGDGVIVGSRIVDLLHQGETETVKQLIQESTQPKVKL